MALPNNDGSIGTAHLRVAATLYSDVAVLRFFTAGGAERAEVTTTGNGVGGWTKPGKRLIVNRAVLTGFIPASADPPPARQSPPAQTEAEVTTDNPVPSELAAVRAELEKARTAAIANFTHFHGTSRMRGKQHKIRGDAALRRASRLSERISQLERQERALTRLETS